MDKNECRKNILERIEEIRNSSNGFSRGTMRWDNFTYDVVKIHVSEINFEEFPDYDLVLLFERLIKRYYQQM